MVLTLSHYTGGNNGWGTMVSECAYCHRIVSEWYCDDNGIPTTPIFDDQDTHECYEDDDDYEEDDTYE